MPQVAGTPMIVGMRPRALRWTAAVVVVALAGLAMAGCHRRTVVEGLVWFDEDFDGTRDPDEAPAAGVTVRVTCQYTDPEVFTNGVCDEATTDEDGRYRLFVRVDPSGQTVGQVEFAPSTGHRAEEPPGVSWLFAFPHAEQRDLAGIDAALVAIGAGNVGDLVWHDDGDGVQEDGEPGVPGIPVELQVGLQVVASTVTGPDGRYLFARVPSGRHTVRFGPLPAGLRFTNDLIGLGHEDSDANPYSGRVSVFVGSGVDDTVDAGVVTAAPGELGRIGDRVWTDVDRDGLQDVGKPGEAGVEVFLVGVNTGQLAFTVTDAAGGYEFLVSTAIAPDQPYQLVFDAPPGRSLSPQDVGGDDAIDSDANPAGGTASFDLGPDETDTTRDAGVLGTDAPQGSIGDRVWHDVDGDGIQDSDEPGVPDVPVELIDSSDTVAASTVTDGDGRYRFSALPAGEFRVRFAVPGGQQLSPPDQGSDDTLDSDADPATRQTPVVTLATGADDLSIDAGLHAVPTGGATIGDLAWHDLDRDGLQDPGEPGLPNVTVTLLDGQGATVATTTTEDGGLYGFANVADGTYLLRFGRPPGLLPTTANVGNDDSIDSDINGGGDTPLVTFTAGQTDLTIDAGFALPA
jgi:hypothetical protein